MGELFVWAKQFDIILELAERSPERDLSERNWCHFSVVYNPLKRPFLIEVARQSDELFVVELAEFCQDVTAMNASPAQKRVLDRLSKTKFIVAMQIPSTDFRSDGFQASGALLRYFILNSNALVQADGEGFYDGEDLILEMGW